MRSTRPPLNCSFLTVCVLLLHRDTWRVNGKLSVWAAAFHKWARSPALYNRWACPLGGHYLERTGMAEKPEDLNLPASAINRIVKEAVSLPVIVFKFFLGPYL